MLRPKDKDAKKNKSDKYVKAPRRNPFSVFLTSFILTLAFAGSVYCMMTIDRNTRAVGWNEQRTELAFAADSRRLDVTLMGKKLELDIRPVVSARNIFMRAKTGYDTVKPSPVRLLDMLFQVSGSRFFGFCASLKTALGL